MAHHRDSFAYHRWIPFALTLVALALMAGMVSMWPEPVPQAACDQTNLTDSHIAEARALMHWSHRGLVHLAILGGLLTIALLYFQIGHWMLKGAAPWLAFIIPILTSLTTSDVWIRRAERWVSYQAGSCLEEALREPWAASHVTWVGGMLRSVVPSVEDLPRWPWLMLGDALLLAILFIAFTELLYLGGRWKLRY